MDLIKLLIFLSSGLGKFIVTVLILAIILPDCFTPFFAVVLIIGVVVYICAWIASFFQE